MLIPKFWKRWLTSEEQKEIEDPNRRIFCMGLVGAAAAVAIPHSPLLQHLEAPSSVMGEPVHIAADPGFTEATIYDVWEKIGADRLLRKTWLTTNRGRIEIHHSPMLIRSDEKLQLEVQSVKGNVIHTLMKDGVPINQVVTPMDPGDKIRKAEVVHEPFDLMDPNPRGGKPLVHESLTIHQRGG